MIKDLLKNKTVDNKLKCLYRTLELLRLEHNEEGRKAREGEIAMEDFRIYQKGSFAIRQTKIFDEINPIKEAENMFSGDEETNPKIKKVQDLKRQGKKESKWDIEINIDQI